MKKNTARIGASSRTVPNSVTDEELAAVSGGVTLTYGGIKWVYTQQKPDGSAGGNVTAKYDLVQAKGA